MLLSKKPLTSNIMNVAIIGSNGFIGSHLTNKLSLNSNLNLYLFGKKEQSVFSSSYPYFQIDLLNKDLITTQFSNIDLIYYLASETIPATSWENPIIEIEKNLKPFIHFTECIAQLNVKKIVFVSSAGTIYGASSEKVIESSDKQPFSPYGIIKLTIEHFLNYFKAKYDLNFDIYRISNVYGEGQNTAKGLGIINTFIENIIKYNQIQIFGDGNNTRNYIYVKDVAELLSYSSYSNIKTSNIFNLSSNDTISINDLTTILKDVISNDFEVIYKEKRQSDNSTIILDNTKLLNLIPNFHYTSIKDGISQTYNHIKKINQ